VSAGTEMSDRAAALIALADDDFAVGHVLTSVSGFGPSLEINVALSSMGQDELGHSRAYYAAAFDDDRDAINRAIYERAGSDFRAAGISWLYDHAWEWLLIKSYLFETADAHRRGAIARGNDSVLTEMVTRMESEEVYHLDFWRGWLATTCENDQAADHLQPVLDVAWHAAQELFDADRFAALVEPSVLSAAAESWKEEAAAELNQLGLVVPDKAAGALPTGGLERVMDEIHAVQPMAPGRW